MKSFKKIAAFGLVFLCGLVVQAQHDSKLDVTLNADDNTLKVYQELTFFNQSNDTISTVVLNDWNHAYSEKNSLLGKRFSDEFVRSFHLASEKQRGNTNAISISDGQNPLIWNRIENQNDLIEVSLPNKLLPKQKILLKFDYIVKVPSDYFTKYGYDSKGNLNLKNWFLAPARYENHQFIKYSNANLDDIVNGISDYKLTVNLPAGMFVNSDLDLVSKDTNMGASTYVFSGKNRNDFSLFVTHKDEFYSFKNSSVDVMTDLKGNKLDDIQRAIVIDRIVNFVHRNIGDYPYEKITISQTDYDRNPFYGLNQLPAFISPFTNEFMFELKFLKTYTNNFIKNSLHIDGRKDNWIYDAIQMYVMMKYMDEQHPDSKMMGSLAKWKILKSYNIINLQFNEQYSYYYMLMARKNLDQPLGDSKETLIRFNEKIASKYRAGLSLKYLDNYLEKDIVPKTVKEFYASNANKETSRADFENLLKTNSGKNIDWFFNTVIDSRDIVDYKFGDVTKTPESITFQIKNKTGTTVPIPVYGLKDKQIVFKDWFENVKTDSTFTVERKDADKIVLNYKNEVPEYNLRNNWRSLKVFFGNDRPYKFAFMKDLEDPNYNQILYVPTVNYNLYDGLSPGIRLHNKTLLDKPFNFDVNPIYSPKTQSLTGNFSFGINQYNRDSELYNIRYGMSGSYFHYAPDATYLKFNPSVSFLFREKDFRDNTKSGITLRYNIVNKENSHFVIDTTTRNYSVFSARYFHSKTEITNHLNYNTDLQFSGEFGKVSGEIQYRKLFDNNRQVNLRLFAGSFIFNKTTDSDYFNFGVSNPNDYLFEYNFFGRSETTGLFSQQIILAEGAFKSKLIPKNVNQYIVTANASFNIWNWIEVYGDLGLVKNHGSDEKFIYDSGIRLNLVTDYFELYFPVYSNNGWEIAQNRYNEKIRFIVTFSPKTLLNLFTRKWF
ncbi:gluzincin family metallopeptidase [Flavobacterium noncentrifugens]|uniref:Peptidase M1 membrane alanine aminopeptidase domain-containing protein n=1 Tax=Flavobacterium noncentrifugens TaxID=1128970 RepID=A0A1G8WP40_9FLAO|nr:aminopeptidase [Flavobacterium noncentrifugens]SDJ79410.1 hypothetical protein SAMN04487935_1877 [Flavobacterium noncentrifugens]